MHKIIAVKLYIQALVGRLVRRLSRVTSRESLSCDR